MARVLIIGAGGVGSVVAHKCAQMGQFILAQQHTKDILLSACVAAYTFPFGYAPL